MSRRFQNDGERTVLFERIAQLQTQLPPPATYSLFPHLFPNDVDFASTIEAATTHTPSPREKDALAIGVVVGNGHTMSMLPEAGVDAMLMLDEDGGLLRWQQYLGSLLIGQEARAGFRAELRSEAAWPRHIAMIIQLGRNSTAFHSPEQRLLVERDSLGSTHFLASEERYRMCREALLETPIAYAQANLLDIATMARIGSAVQTMGEITFFNATNVADYATASSRLADYRKTLSLLPLHPDAFIAYSSWIYRAANEPPKLVSPPVCYWSQGVDGYLAAFEENVPNIPYFGDPTELVWGRQPGTSDRLYESFRQAYGEYPWRQQ
jgi:hypothetical protein